MRDDNVSRQDSNTIRQSQQGNGMFRCASIGQPVLKLLGCDRAVTAVIIRPSSVDLPNDWLGNLRGGLMGFFFYRVGTIMTRTPFDRNDFSVWYQLKKVTGSGANILYSLMAGSVIGNLA